VDSESDEVMRK